MKFLHVILVGVTLFYLNAEVAECNVPILLVHGGAGDISEATIPSKKLGVKLATRIGYEKMLSTGSAMDGVEAAVRSMELDAQFNAGYGAVLTWEGKVEMDAAIMDGSDLNAGCVSIARDIYHPITLARRIMEKTRHKYLAGDGAMSFAVAEGFQLLMDGALVTPNALKSLEDFKNSFNGSTPATFKAAVKSCDCDIEYGSPGTVGAVAIDEFGNVAAATSTGGITGKMPGRIGDSPVLGAGTFADNAAGTVSATGHGETFMRYTVASRILSLIQYEGMSAQEATSTVLENMTERFNQTGGAITIDVAGNVGIYFTSRRMSWAYQRGEELHYGVDKDEDVVEIIGKARIDLD